MSHDPATGDAPARLSLRDPFMPMFLQLLLNVLLVSVINFTVWFAITFFVYLQTRSVFATGVIAGIFLLATVLTGIWFGSIVDHHAKKLVMQVSALASLAFYAVGVRALPRHPRGGVPRPDQRAAVGLRRPAHGRGDGRQPAHHRAADRRDRAGPRGQARPRQRAGGHDVRRQLPRDVGDQRPARGLERHARRAGAGARRRRAWPSSTCQLAGRARRHVDRRRPERLAQGRPARHHPPGPQHPRHAGADRLRRRSTTSSAASSWPSWTPTGCRWCRCRRGA